MNQNSQTPEKRNIVWIFLSIANLVLIIFIISKVQNSTATPEVIQTVTKEIFASNTFAVEENGNGENKINQQTTPGENMVEGSQLFFISIKLNQQSKIYLLNPYENKFTQLFDDPYEQIHPAISNDQTKLAYSAKKNGYWDIYILDLSSGLETRVTDSPAYDGSPTWSSDDLYLAYESYQTGNLDIFIQDIIDLSITPIQLTNDKNPQFSPVWSPNGRDIAFVSTQTDNEEIWLAKLDALEDRFLKITDRPNHIDINPSWSADGEFLLWSSEQNGYPIILMTEINNLQNHHSELAIGTEASYFSNTVVTIQSEANQQFLVSKNLSSNLLNFSSIRIPGNVHGFAQIQNYRDNSNLLASLQKNPTITQNTMSENQVQVRKDLGLIENLETDRYYLLEDVIEPFNKFRSYLALETGWDLLFQLENAFLPITEPEIPGINQDWLFTGRAFEFNPLSTHAGLVKTIKEERNGQVFWRIFIKTRYQDGSQGLPLRIMPFDISARYDNDPISYESGGKYTPIPEGYWYDLTELAQSINWERVPAFVNWQYYFESARFNQFVYSDGMDWYSAMKQIYPLEAFMTPSPIPTNQLTPTSSPTIRLYRSPTITFTPTETVVPTYRPTWTPQP